ncbi:HECT-domain-containing protein [Gorgonomyces haynaldii]|nr:HECT-domain-containing protein [Gorgonomyces haynaldii]
MRDFVSWHLPHKLGFQSLVWCFQMIAEFERHQEPLTLDASEFISCILTIPNLAPFQVYLATLNWERILSQVQNVQLDQWNRMHLLCNLLLFQKISKPINPYLSCLTSLISSLNSQFFEILKPQDEDEEPRQTLALEPFHIQALQTLVSKQHFQTICKTIRTNVNQFALFTVTLFSNCPNSKTELLTTVLYQSPEILQVLYHSIMQSHLYKTQSLSFEPETLDSWNALFLFAELYSMLLFTCGDDEFFSEKILSIDQVIKLSKFLKDLGYHLLWREDLNGKVITGRLTTDLIKDGLTRLLKQIHSRDSRRQFCPKDHWTVDFKTESLFNGTESVVLEQLPFVIPLEDRIKLFRALVRQDQMDLYGLQWQHPVARVNIRRDHIFEDGFAQLNSLQSQLKRKIAITFIDEHGLTEAGIDGGGVFKEFLTLCLKEAFAPNIGLFETTQDQLLYPATTTYATEPEQLKYFEFMGRIIGKALYEDVLLESPFAGFFLRKWIGLANYLDDLPSLDKELYQGLIYLKNCDNAEDLSLNFTLREEQFGTSQSIDLIPNGSNVAVTNENRIRYIYLVAHYKLNLRLQKQVRAFFSGLIDLIDPKWLKMFNEQELQLLLGGTHLPIDVNDFKQNVVYDSVYDEKHPTIEYFWQVVEEMSQEDKEKLIKFITSCSRPPILGFSELMPRISIRFAGQEQDRLPTASTCVNLLKLPGYKSKELLREKILYAISAGAGFELS